MVGSSISCVMYNYCCRCCWLSIGTSCHENANSHNKNSNNSINASFGLWFRSLSAFSSSSFVGFGLMWARMRGIAYCMHSTDTKYWSYERTCPRTHTRKRYGRSSKQYVQNICFTVTINFNNSSFFFFVAFYFLLSCVFVWRCNCVCYCCRWKFTWIMLYCSNGFIFINYGTRWV